MDVGVLGDWGDVTATGGTRAGADCRLGSGRWAKPMGYTCALLQPSRMGDLLGAPSRQRARRGLKFDHGDHER